ncbi:MAG: hypothetical protein FJX59_13445 [Alphaproteobacteria bacterium]|nr:hypothetical protein [Alphaproteobacteria bacterium]
MALVFVAKSKGLQEWGSDVGISKNLFKVGLFDGKATDAAADLNGRKYLGQDDWTVIGKREAEVADEAPMLDKMAERVSRVDPGYYPRIKGDRGIFKVNIHNIEAQLVVQSAMTEGDAKVPKIKPADIANYLIDAALRV